VANDRNRSRNAAIEVCLHLNFPVVSISMYFCFRQVNKNLIGDVLKNRRIGKTRKIGTLFFLFYSAHCLLTHRIILHRRCGTNRKKIREIKLGNYARSKIGPSCLLAQGALLRQYIGAGITIFRFRFPK
jgi:hypothetical protein